MIAAARRLAQRYELGAFIRYGVVGVGQNALSYGCLLLLLTLGWPAWTATALIYPVAVLVSFIINRAWSFGERQRSRGELVRYIAVYVMIYPLAVAAVWAMEHAGLPGWLASAIAMVAAAVGAFVLMNYWVFRR